MAKFDDALRGYARPTLERDKFVCQYCGWDGRTSFGHWTFLSVDHLVPEGHPKREDPQYKVTACRFCNELANRDKPDVEGKTPDELVKQRKRLIQPVRNKYRKFWQTEVRGRLCAYWWRVLRNLLRLLWRQGL